MTEPAPVHCPRCAAERGVAIPASCPHVDAVAAPRWRIRCDEHESLLRARGALDGHATVADAVAALATLYPAPVAHDYGDGLTVWPSPEAHDDDPDARYAVATIHGHDDYPVGTRLLVETMPDWLIESHRAARNFGAYPHNGAERRIVDADAVDDYVTENGYDRVVRVASAADVARYGDRD